MAGGGWGSPIEKMGKAEAGISGAAEPRRARESHAHERAVTCRSGSGQDH